MARHIMAVCVVCLLFADHLHCQQDHVGNIELIPAIGFNEQLNASVYPSPSNETTEQRQLGVGTPNYSISPPYRRSKRHAGHEHGHERLPYITLHFLQELLRKGTDNATTESMRPKMKTTAFQHLLEQLNLYRLVDGGDSNGTCVTDSELVHHVQKNQHSHHENSLELSGNCTENDSNSSTACASIQKNEHHKDYELSENDLLNLCPVLLYQLTAPEVTRSAGCIDRVLMPTIEEFEEQDNRQVKVWIYAFTSVFFCGILGLVGVAIIPFMGSRYYKHIIQYLVSLAVGTMTGDALLHLLPHSLAGQNEEGMIMKGLACLGGVIFFYVTEHALTMISEWRKSVEKKETKKPSRAKVMRDPDSSVNNSVAGDRMCKQKYSSYPYCYDEITTDNKQDVWMHLPGSETAAQANAAGAGVVAAGGSDGSNLRNGKAEHDGSTESAAAAQSLLSTSHNHYAEMNHHNHKHNNHQQQEQTQTQALDSTNNTITNDLDGNAVFAVNNSIKDKDLEHDKNDHVTVILREHESSHHGHSHRHGHVHSPPETLSAVAWMIIMGDGLHNFTDGMAIGAAFAENIAGGFSTSMAVFCHELPHELGDFAILMKAGMSVRSAVYYNMLTGVLSFIGMIFGIVFGQSQEAAKWMFAVAAGLFIYIALVDMMPEISAAHKSLAQFLLQILGMLSGVLIMLLIAIYEGDLMSAFGTSSAAGVHHQHVH
ncbi:zinc transporter foi [Scaptodrosophila lebanonensis]|uniref:Zinc transporter foi n=1 Tax=Drosophila lebanonensis TaxID=7225 RepID=A0A6J2UBU1_DROLE|nr:zinc transporter foi [Scaptodrosophila lebanonensis]XP_030385951.1 zinc transporter foi [Scaptodrosophila lebanonensis]